MKKGIIFIINLIILGLLILTVAISCKPINIFSPLVDPSKMGNEAKLDAGYNALASGNYDDAIDYFTSVINSSSGSEKTDAYLGRASAYLHSAAPNLDNVVNDLTNGNVSADSTGDIINEVVGDSELDVFFDSTQNAADDYNNAVDESTDIDPGVLLEAYQANMMAATGVGAQAIANLYNLGNNSYSNIWEVTATSPTANISGYGTVTFNMELDAIITSDRVDSDDLYHPYNISTWSDSTAANNGLNKYVKDNSTAKNSMMGYLTEAYNDLEQLKSNPPEGMTATDISGMQNTILEWAVYGLGDSSLGTPTS